MIPLVPGDDVARVAASALTAPEVSTERTYPVIGHVMTVREWSHAEELRRVRGRGEALLRTRGQLTGDEPPRAAWREIRDDLSMRVVVAGSSGFLGTLLISSLRRADHDVIRLVRRSPTAPDEYGWDPSAGQMDAGALKGADAVVNLCGAGIADKRWSAARKQLLKDSRIEPTEVLAAAVAEHDVPVLLNASASGYYGDTGSRLVDESAPAGTGFLAGMCRGWEAATQAAEDAGARVVRMRTAVVLASSGGLLGRMRPVFTFMLGGKFGDGRQYLPWIHMDDAIEGFRFALERDTLRGPVNLGAPHLVTNAEFTAELGAALHRPAPWTVPSFALRAVLGELAEEALLPGQRMVPRVLRDNGFEFRYPTLGEALAAVTAR